MSLSAPPSAHVMSKDALRRGSPVGLALLHLLALHLLLALLQVVSPSWRASTSRHPEPAGTGHHLSHTTAEIAHTMLMLTWLPPGAMT